MSISQHPFISSLLESSNLEEFASRALFTRTPHVFDADDAGYLGWRHSAASLLGADALNVFIVGSGATGVSLNPRKHFRQFGPHSDIDVAVISPWHFDTAWRSIRRQPTHSLSKTKKQAISKHESHHVYWGTITTDSILALLPFAKEWLHARSKMQNEPPTEDRDIRFRLYRDIDSLRIYQVRSLATARTELAKTSGSLPK